ncbi:hypothetical protein [Candidatus Poriferisodalis sp.]|uniref:hypothetical protein n=1 Tax=Candidatus Poriferisodalis sp. TaxID=3101277 RepID=UPI003B02908E
MSTYEITESSARVNIQDLKGCGFLEPGGNADSEMYPSQPAREWMDSGDDDLAFGILHANVRFIGEILFELRTGVRSREQLLGIANRKYGFSWQTRGQVGDRLCWLRSAGYVVALGREERRVTSRGLEFLERIDLHLPA